jgi:DNA-binding MarR family transcriptional regulator/GNAT superfamily N-acetyltransferase
MQFFDQAGPASLGSRLRILSEQLMDQAQSVYDAYGVELRSVWFPVFYALSQKGRQSVTELAAYVGQSHPGVSRTLRELKADGLIEEGKDPADKRRNLVSLSEKGKRQAAKLEEQLVDVHSGVDQMLNQSTHNLWLALQEFEFLLQQKPFDLRVLEARKEREKDDIELVDYTPAFRSAFRDLNVAWISKYFTMESSDYHILDHPDTHIIQPGGHIIVALYKGEPVGVCALVVMDDDTYDFELAKMAVSPAARGKGIGYLLGKAALERAQEVGAGAVYLESNTVLAPAIKLYQKLGFQKIAGRPSPYERCNIQMGYHFDLPKGR